MTDSTLEKVIKGLECCISEKTCHSHCPYNGECEEGGYYYSKAIEDAIALLKAQQPRVHGRWIANDDCGELECPICGGIQIEHGMFCTWCGAKMSGGVQDDD